MIPWTAPLLLATPLLQPPSEDPLPAVPHDFSYSFLDARFGYESVDGQAEAGGTFDVRGSIELLDPVYVGARFRGFEVDLPADSTATEVSTNSIYLTLGYHAAVGPRTDFLADLSLLTFERTTILDGVLEVEDDDTDAVLGTSLRHLLTPRVEIEARVQYSIERRAALLEVGPRIQVHDSLQLGLVYESGTSPEGRTGSSVLLGARLLF